MNETINIGKLGKKNTLVRNGFNDPQLQVDKNA